MNCEYVLADFSVRRTFPLSVNKLKCDYLLSRVTFEFIIEKMLLGMSATAVSTADFFRSGRGKNCSDHDIYLCIVTWLIKST